MGGTKTFIVTVAVCFGSGWSALVLMFYSSLAVSVGWVGNGSSDAESSGARDESRSPVSALVSCALAVEAALDNTVTHPCPDSVPGVTHRAGCWSRGSLGGSVSRTSRVSSLAQNLLVLPGRRAFFCHLAGACAAARPPRWDSSSSNAACGSLAGDKSVSVPVQTGRSQVLAGWGYRACSSFLASFLLAVTIPAVRPAVGLAVSLSLH